MKKSFITSGPEVTSKCEQSCTAGWCLMQWYQVVQKLGTLLVLDAMVPSCTQIGYLAGA